MIIVWGKLVGLALGVFGGLLGAGFGLLIGHLLDVVAADYLLRRAIARYLGSAGGRLPRQFVRIYAVASLTAAAVAGRGWIPEPATRASFARAFEALAGDRAAKWRRLRGRLERWRVARYLDNAARLDSEIDPELLTVRVREILDARSARALLRLCLSLGPPVDGAARVRTRLIAHGIGIEGPWLDAALRGATTLDAVACEILGVSQNADLPDVRRAYRALAGQFHPDTATVLSPEQQSASARAFVRIREAYETLCGQLKESDSASGDLPGGAPPGAARSEGTGPDDPKAGDTRTADAGPAQAGRGDS